MSTYESDIFCPTCGPGNNFAITCIDCGYPPDECFCGGLSGDYHCNQCRHIFFTDPGEDDLSQELISHYTKSDDHSPICRCDVPGTLVCGKCRVWRNHRNDAWSPMVDKPRCYCQPEERFFCKKCGVERNKVDDLWDWEIPGSYFHYKCRHYFEQIVLPNGVKVYASSQFDRRDNEEHPDFGMYLSSVWTPVSLAYYVPWQDYGIPDKPEIAAKSIIDVYNKAVDGLKVEIGCMGGHGRTGCAIACMYVLAGCSPAEAISRVRKEYCREAIEGLKQEWWITWFEAYSLDKKLPDPPDALFKSTWRTGKKEEDKLPVYMHLEKPAKKVAKAVAKRSSGKRQANRQNHRKIS